MTELSAILGAFTTFFVIIDPVGLVPVFIALTRGQSPRQRRAIALRACLVALGLILLFLVLGEAVLTFLGITMPAFRIAGGILLFLTALMMLFERASAQPSADDHPQDPSVFPLALPLIAGPGAITSAILLAGQIDGAVDKTIAAGVITVVLSVVFVSMLAAPTIERVLGRTGVTVITRLLGMLLAALAVQFILDGLRTGGLTG